MRRPVFLCAVTFVAVQAPLSASLAQPATTSAEEALRQAVAARDAALVALDKANQAIAGASQALQRSSPPALAPEIATATSNGNPAPFCRVGADSPAVLLRHAANYGEQCLLKDHTKDIRLTGVLQDEKAAIIAAYTDYNLKPSPKGWRNTYHRVRGGFTKAKQGQSFPIYDVGGGQWLRGWGLTAGYEYGRTASRTNDAAQKGIKEFLAAARRDCLAAKIPTPAADPLTVAGTQLQVRTLQDAYASCDGENLAKWMASDDGLKDKYYKAFSLAVLRPEKIRAIYGGLNASIAFPRFQYVPSDALPLAPATGQAAKPSELQIDEKTHELRAYVGGNTSKHFALEGGISHRRIFEEGGSRTICPTGTTGFVECWSLRTAPPSELRGLVADARAAFLIDDLPYLAGLGLLLTPSYEFDADRWSANGAIYFAADDNDKLTSGLNVRCKGKGHDRAGNQLDKDCKAEVFISTSFSVRK